MVCQSHPSNVHQLFKDWQEGIVWSCVQGIMGQLYANAPGYPDAAMAILGDFCFFAGAPDKELILYKPESCRQDFMIMVPQDERWAAAIVACYQDRAKKVTRYATCKERSSYTQHALDQVIKTLPAGYSLTAMDEQLYHRCRADGWSRDLVSQYPDYETYRRLGLGFVVLQDGEPVSGASSYASFDGGIEIEIDTKPEHRRLGLASACGASLISECLARNLYPSWDAQNAHSLALAEKLGYHYSHSYPAYEIWGY